MENIDVAVVIVTYNRKELLCNCIDSLLVQKNAANVIYIVDNNSTDGTKQHLVDQGYLNSNKICYELLQSNIGGAGGFSYCLNKAFNEKHDYYYLMDDDGIPTVNALDILINNAKKYDIHYINSLVIDVDDHKMLSFGLNNKGKKIYTFNDVQNINEDILYGTASPFNGLILSHKLVEKIGVPKKEMFIWGDEAEYMMRTQAAGFKVATALTSIHYHPRNKKPGIKIFFGRFVVSDIKGVFRTYIFHRNRAYIYSEYRKTKKRLIYKFQYYWYYFLKSKNKVKNIKVFNKAMKDGRKKIFLSHEEIFNKFKINSINE